MSKKTTGILIGLAAAGAIAAGTAATLKYLSDKKKKNEGFDFDLDEADDFDESRDYVNIPFDSEDIEDVVDDAADAVEDIAEDAADVVEDIADSVKDIAEEAADKVGDFFDDLKDSLEDITE